MVGSYIDSSFRISVKNIFLANLFMYIMTGQTIKDNAQYVKG